MRRYLVNLVIFGIGVSSVLMALGMFGAQQEIAIQEASSVPPAVVPPAVALKNDLYKRAIEEIENRNPELNPDLPDYRADLAQEVLQQRDSYITTGMDEPEALRKAVAITINEEAARQRKARDEKEQLLQGRYSETERARQETLIRQAEIRQASQLAEIRQASQLAVRGQAAQRSVSGYVGTPMSIPNPSPPQPSVITNCDAAGCWDNLGGRYNKGAGNTYFPSGGGACQSVGGQMMCN